MSFGRGLPRRRSLRLSDSGVNTVSAAERLGIKSSPPKRAPSLSSLEDLGGSFNISGKDKNYNYKNPPHTLDRVTVEKIIEEEKKKRALADQEIEDGRRHSDFLPTKGPIITDDRFRDILADAKPIEDNPSQKETRACAVALHTFPPQSQKELGFKKGDMLYLIRKIDKNWYEGEHHGRTGIFPKSYIEIVTSLDEARKNQLIVPSKEGKAKARFKFKGETQTELNFNKHDYIDLIRRIDANWWEGRIGPRTGIFPNSYVEVLKEPEVVLPVTTSPTRRRSGSHHSTDSNKGPPLSPSARMAHSPKLTSAKQQQVRSQPRDQSTSPRRIVDERLTQTQAPVPVQSQPSYQQAPRTTQHYNPAGQTNQTPQSPRATQQHSPAGQTNQTPQSPRATQHYSPAGQTNQTPQSPRAAQHYSSAGPTTQTPQSPKNVPFTPSSQQNYQPPHPGVGQTYPVDTKLPAPITRQPQNNRYQAMYNYIPQNADELALTDGDMVTVLEKCDDGWFVGTSHRTGLFGTFPGNYVVQL